MGYDPRAAIRLGRVESCNDGKEKASALTIAILVHAGFSSLWAPSLIVTAESKNEEQMLEKPEMVSNVKMDHCKRDF